jgi:thermostable 8-oxoguanine DNA glycosylase
MTSDNQLVQCLRGDRIEILELPPASEELLPGVKWGRYDVFFTPAFWRARLWIDGEHSPLLNYSLGRTLTEEVAACLLGGYGMPAELGLAAYARLRSSGLLSNAASQSDLEQALREPFYLNGRKTRYRYPAQKSRFLYGALQKLCSECPPVACPYTLRNWLVAIPGIGMKTASWVIRNFLHSSSVAILDIHIIRAGIYMGLFPRKADPQKHYLALEKRLVSFASALDEDLARLDSVIWCYMRKLT